jgi:hypothetical protein
MNCLRLQPEVANEFGGFSQKLNKGASVQIALAEALRNFCFFLFSAEAFLVADKPPASTGGNS